MVLQYYWKVKHFGNIIFMNLNYLVHLQEYFHRFCLYKIIIEVFKTYRFSGYYWKHLNLLY
jgi:hypothetical protein